MTYGVERQLHTQATTRSCAFDEGPEAELVNEAFVLALLSHLQRGATVARWECFAKYSRCAAGVTINQIKWNPFKDNNATFDKQIRNFYWSNPVQQAWFASRYRKVRPSKDIHAILLDKGCWSELDDLSRERWPLPGWYPQWRDERETLSWPNIYIWLSANRGTRPIFLSASKGRCDAWPKLLRVISS